MFIIIQINDSSSSFFYTSAYCWFTTTPLYRNSSIVNALPSFVIYLYTLGSGPIFFRKLISFCPN